MEGGSPGHEVLKHSQQVSDGTALLSHVDLTAPTAERVTREHNGEMLVGMESAPREEDATATLPPGRRHAHEAVRESRPLGALY